jgi:hAT family C-terminal dimerisation region
MTESTSDLREYKLADDEWELLEGTHKFFGLFKVASEQLYSTSYPTLATAVPVYNLMIDHLEDYRDTDTCPAVIKVATDAAIDKLKKFYLQTDAEVYAVATILDPHFKLDYHHDNDWEQEWIELARRTFRNAYARYRAPPAPDAREKAPSSWRYSVGNNGHVHHYDKDTVSVKCAYKRRRVTERDEFKEYLNAPPAAEDVDTLEWWKMNAGIYPCLAAMARDYLAIPATSVPVECVFSGGTDLVQSKRGALSEDTIQTCMCLKSWLKLPG